MRHIPWKTTVIVIALVLALALSLQAEASGRKPTPLGLWVQSIQHTERAERMGCNIAPPYSTRCWEHILDSKGRITRTVYHYAPPKGWKSY
jgi:hypothetical protein